MSSTAPYASIDAGTPQRGPITLARLLAAMTVVWAVAYLPWLGLLDLQFEEPRRALVAQAMLASGEYWVPQLAGEPYGAKPPLFNWTIAASATLLGGLTEFSARLPSVLCVLALAVLFVFGARDVLKPWPLAFLGASLILSPEILAKGRLAEIEPLFALLVAASIGCWYRLYAGGARGVRLWVLPLALTALAYLTKREPAVVFFYFAVGPFLVLRGQWRRLFEPGHFAGIAVAALIVSGWLVGMAEATSWSALWDTLRREVLERGVSGQGVGDVLAHVVFYPAGLFVGMLPFAALLPLLLSRDIRTRVRTRFGDLFFFSVVTVLVNLPIYWLRGEVAIRYFLPMFPFMLLLAAMVYDVLHDGLANAARPLRRYLAVVHWTAFAVAALGIAVLLGSLLLPSFVDGYVPLLPAAATLALGAVGIAALWAFARQRARAPLATLLLVFCAAVLAVRGVYFNVVLADRAVRYEADRNAPRIAAEVARIAGGAPIGAAEVPWAVWYYGETLTLQRLTAASRPTPGNWLLVREDLAAQFPLAEQARFAYKDEVLLLGRAD